MSRKLRRLRNADEARREADVREVKLRRLGQAPVQVGVPRLEEMRVLVAS